MTKTFATGIICTVMQLALLFGHTAIAQVKQEEKPKIAFTFDDGSTADFGSYKLETWNQLLLDNLKRHQVRAILFSSGFNKATAKGKYVLSSWNNAGHRIANHTFSHQNFNSKIVTLERFKLELIQNDTIINKYSNFYRYFRFPYLKEGNTKEKVDGFRQFLKQKEYRNGHVTIDASDWYVDSRLVNRLKINPTADISGSELNVGLVFRKFEELEFLTNHSRSKMPLTKEFRLFFLNGKIIQQFNYWDEGDYGDTHPELKKFEIIGRKVMSSFFTMDIAKKKDGDWIIMELGDGQVSGLPDNADKNDFYRSLKEFMLKQ